MEQMPNLNMSDASFLQDSSGVREIEEPETTPRPKLAEEKAKEMESVRDPNELADPFWMNPNKAAAIAKESAKVEKDIQDGEDRASMEGQTNRIAVGLPGDYEEPIPRTFRSAELKSAEDQGKRIPRTEPSVVVQPSLETDASFDPALVTHFTEPGLQDESSGVREKPQQETGTDAAAM